MTMNTDEAQARELAQSKGYAVDWMQVEPEGVRRLVVYNPTGLRETYAAVPTWAAMRFLLTMAPPLSDCGDAAEAVINEQRRRNSVT